MTLTSARGFKLFKLSRRWTNKNKTREGPRQLFHGPDEEEPDSHLDLPSGLQGGSENKHHLREDERRVYLSLQSTKMVFRFRMHQVGPSKSGSAMKSTLSSFLSVNTSSQLKQCRSVFFLFAYNR